MKSPIATKTFETSYENFCEMDNDPYCPLVSWLFLGHDEDYDERRVLVTVEIED